MAKAQKENIRWRPSPKQNLFLMCWADEVLFGGAAGGGKSDALLMAAMGGDKDNFFTCKDWHTLVLRRSFPELEKTLIRRSLQLFHGLARYNAVAHKWTSPAGGTIQFG